MVGTLLFHQGVQVAPHRLRWFVALAAVVFIVTLLLGTLRHASEAPRPATPAAPVKTKAINWGTANAQPAAPNLPLLRIGAYITNISNIDLLDDQFSVELLLWTQWNGDPAEDPSDELAILNGIYDGDIQRFERVSREPMESGTWSLYRVRSAVVKRWHLQRYPFDDQILHVQIGLNDPLQPVQLDVVEEDPFDVSPGLLLPGWTLKTPSAYASSISLMSELGQPPADGVVIRRQPTVSLDLPIYRRSLLFVAPDFLGYMLAIGLCCMSLLITHSRDDLILAAVVSAGGNYVFIAGNLPVTAMTGFIGNLQLIIFLGILYVVAADELIDNHLSRYNQRFSNLLRALLLPSYVGITLMAIALIIP
jgi:hypothetical protein